MRSVVMTLEADAAMEVLLLFGATGTLDETSDDEDDKFGPSGDSDGE